MQVVKLALDDANASSVPTDDGVTQYRLGAQGASCAATCAAVGLACNPAVVTGNSTAIFEQLGASCMHSATGAVWEASYQPSVVTSRSDGNFFRCARAS